MQDYEDVVKRLGALYEEVRGCEFYEEMFPDNERSGDTYEDYSHPNAIYLYRDLESGDAMRQRRRIMLEDTWEEEYFEYVEGNPLALCSGIAYRGRRNRLQDAQRMYALIFDLDGVGDGELSTLLRTRFGKPAKQMRSLPMPTYLVASGKGLHIYYLFDQPIDLYPSIKAQLKALKHDLTYKMWDWKGTSKIKSIQYQSIVQSFRMVGSVNEKYGNVVRAFRTGERVTLDTMNEYVMDSKNRVLLDERKMPGKTPISVAKKKWPEWYQTRVVDGVPSVGRWDIAGKVNGKDPYALYHWFLQFAPQILVGHRYFYMMCCVIYASKCGVPYQQLREDMKAVFERLLQIEHDNNPLTERDMKSALKIYKRDFYNITLEDIERMTGLRLPRNRRNGRQRSVHIKIMNSTRDILYPNGEWRNKDGRPSKGEIVLRWRLENPHKRKIDCEHETGLSRPTVLKWWDYEDAQEMLAFVQRWRVEHPEGDVEACVRATGLPRETIYKWWGALNEALQIVADEHTEDMNDARSGA